MRDIKFRAWAKYGEMLDNVQNHIGNDSWAFGNILNSDDFVMMQFTGLRDKNGVEIYEGDLINIFYTDKHEQWIFDGVYRVDLTPSGVKLTFTKLLWELDGYNQLPYERADFSEYGFVRNDYKNKNEDSRLCIAESNKWNYSNYFEIIGNIYENPELLQETK